MKNPKELTRPPLRSRGRRCRARAPFSYTRHPMPSKFARKARFTAPPFVQIRTPRPDAPAGNEPSKKPPATVSTSPRHRRQAAPFPTGWNAARRYNIQADSYSLFHVEHFVSIFCKYLLQISFIMQNVSACGRLYVQETRRRYKPRTAQGKRSFPAVSA